MPELAHHEKLWLGSVVEYFVTRLQSNSVSTAESMSTAKIKLLIWMLHNNKSSLVGKTIKDISERADATISVTTATLKVLSLGDFIYKDKTENSYYINFRTNN